MKKILLLLFLSLFILSCGTTQSTSEEGVTKKSLKGTWKVAAVKVENSGVEESAILFNMAESFCFEGSEWVFVPNNGSGKFNIKAKDQCEPVATRIHWSFFNPGDGTYQFQFKYVDEFNKPIDGSNRGYSAQKELVSSTQIRMRVELELNGKTQDVLLDFTKVSNDLSV